VAFTHMFYSKDRENKRQIKKAKERQRGRQEITAYKR
jgi:hypothetical protein